MRCEGCIFLETYQDMGWSCDICALQDELGNAIKACKCSADCLYKTTVEETKVLRRTLARRHLETNREQIIKALRCCGGDIMECQNCAYATKGYNKCKECAAQDALSLIRELTEEKEIVKADTVRRMRDMLTTFFRNDETLEYSEVNADYVNEQIDQIAKELLEGNQ